MRELPCPCCGFLTLEGDYGSYIICPVCNWQDDPVQFANPCSAGGANSLSLAAAQSTVLLKYPVGIEVAAGFRRARAWRPLSPAELEAAEVKRAIAHWNAKAILQESEAYWSQS